MHTMPDENLLSPLTIRDVVLRNRIAVSPMCQYSADNGYANDWHLVHLGSRAVGGAGLVFVEATAVTPQGRISPKDLGLWEDGQIEQLARIAHFVESVGSVPAIQLAHAGRKAACDVPWHGGAPLSEQNGGWPTVAPSPIPFSKDSVQPQELDQHGIASIIDAFKKAAIRALKAGFKILEIHAAHGYLLHEFLSPISNHRTDNYGGSLDNRMRLLCQVVDTVRDVMPATMPLFVRISATDWVEGGWDLEQSILLSRVLAQRGVDLIDVSTGGSVSHAQIQIAPGYQVPFAAEIRYQADIMTGAVGMITEVDTANAIVKAGYADLIFLAREFLREPYWVLKAQEKLQADPSWPVPYGYAIRRRPPVNRENGV
jgi:2,4-dienoyl-CoA reductase-like NADH-dependent reductase (Old Yellow Enzyme family)